MSEKEEETNEINEASQPLGEGKILFSFPNLSDLPKWSERIKLELEPEGHTVISALYDMRELLMHIEDYDLIKKLGNTDKGGLWELSKAVQVALPRYYTNHPEMVKEYQAYLANLELLVRDWVLKYDQKLKQGYPVGPRPGVLELYSREIQVHDHAVMLYAMAIAALGEETYNLAHTLLDYFTYYRYDVPDGLAWVRNRVTSYYHYGYARLYDDVPFSGRGER